MKKFTNSLLLLILLLSFEVTRQDCAFTVDPDGKPQVAKDKDAKPQIHKYSAPFICDKIYTGATCCNDYQNNQMASNFLQIDATFGSIGNGCDNCASNLKRFWCTYTCDPNQSDFVVIGPKPIVVPNPIDEGATTLTVQDVSILVDSQTVCDVWSSCNLTPYATQVSAMKTPAGFLSFQGANAVTQAAQSIRVNYTSDASKNPLTLHNITKCNAPQPKVNKDPAKAQPWYPDAWGFNISQNCSCNNCADACTLAVFTPLPVMQGFDYLVVGLFYGFLLVFTIGCWFFRRRRQMKKDQESQQQLEQQEQQEQQYEPLHAEGAQENQQNE
ncbi:transmembrane protein, putative (macronuclear) [Tetrahymena thermophila SB210]|uniref:Transmembrane protein, putative n=1 Tax=Tetrahymena thermophila (strain SB210) TaxID=312017 RepID=I7MEP7_TETTS|nr:transmembrane protein, putative [Tetrahymena thermophila SB210]EAR97324.1 transmembrane protein, putative [Tetrahymena thermophila SB210]|eukprot:XP_001017569.1 transmembrane protein, putative [Tetrahymena thermophila SB210]